MSPESRGDSHGQKLLVVNRPTSVLCLPRCPWVWQGSPRSIGTKMLSGPGCLMSLCPSCHFCLPIREAHWGKKGSWTCRLSWPGYLWQNLLLAGQMNHLSSMALWLPWEHYAGVGSLGPQEQRLFLARPLVGMEFLEVVLCSHLSIFWTGKGCLRPAGTKRLPGAGHCRARLLY